MFLVLGNVAVDETMAAPVLPGPGATVLVGPPSRDLGGKGANQAIILARCGVPTKFHATIGSDADGDWIAAELEAEGLPARDLIRLHSASDRSLIFVAPTGENAIASTSHCSDALSASDAEAAIAAASPGNILVTQGGLTAATTQAAFRTARARGLAIVFNPSALREGFRDLLPLADLVVLNAGEARELAGEAAPETLLDRLCTGTQTIVITLGRDGAIALGPEGTVRTPAAPTTASDTTGAGDTFLAVLAAAHYGLTHPLARALPTPPKPRP